MFNRVFKVLECSGGLFQETNGALELARTDVGVDISSEADLANALAIVLVENSFCSDMQVDQEKFAMDEFISTFDVNILADSDVRIWACILEIANWDRLLEIIDLSLYCVIGDFLSKHLFNRVWVFSYGYLFKINLN